MIKAITHGYLLYSKHSKTFGFLDFKGGNGFDTLQLQNKSKAGTLFI